MAAGGSLGLLCLMGGSSGASALGISPSPAPCSLPPPLTCSVPAPMPSALPPPPTGGGGSTGGSGGTSSSGGSSTSPASSPQRSSSPSLYQSEATPLVSVADQNLISTELADPALVGPLLAVLENPVATQRPDLLHFDPTALRRQARSRALPSPQPIPDRALTPTPGAPGRPATTPPSGWAQLVAVETRLAAQHRVLVLDEMEIAALTRSLTHADPEDVTLARERDVTTRLQVLVARHEAAEPPYAATLQAEYAIYGSAAGKPALATQLRQHAHTAGPRVQTAVQTDLQIVSTQLRQEAAIAAALAKLQKLGFSDAHLKALQSRDAFIAPAGGPIGQPFGPTAFPLEPPLVYRGTFYQHFHTGLDIDAPFNSPVQAAMAGVVVLVTSSTDGHGHSTGYGNYVVIQHGHGYATLYGHLNRVLVKAGQVVAQGDVIGLVGTTGNSTGPHLHFEIRRDGEFVDPLPYVTGALKPW